MTDLVIRDETHYLATVAGVRDLTTRIEQVGEARDLADRARAAQVWAQRAKLGAEQVNLAAIARLWAERRAGELLREMPKNDGGRPTETPQHPGGVSTLADIGVTYNESSDWQKLAAISADDFQAAIDVASEEGIVSRAKVERLAVHFSSTTDDWATPRDLFDLLDGEFRFELDVCASDGNHKAPTYFTADDDGLAQDWTGFRCWMNPPYGSQIGEWVKKAHHSATSDGTVVVCLVPARTDTAWWWDHARHGSIRFIRGRLKFGDAGTSAPFPSAVVIFGRGTGVEWWEAWNAR